MFGQAQTLHFEVISVKPPPPIGQSIGRLGCTGNRFVFAGVPFTRLVQWAYDLPPIRIQGLPTWVTDYVDKTESMYEIDARASTAVSEPQCKAMVRSLIVDRFKMASRIEVRDMRVLALTVTKQGPKMREVKPGTPGAGVKFNQIPLRSVVTLGDLPEGISMAVLARRLSGFRVPVIDRTGLTGTYSFELSFSTREDDGLPAMPTAVEEQLGLKLEPARAALEVLVVSHIERPVAN